MYQLAEATVTPTAMACARCGAAMETGSLFCTSCGAVASASPEGTPVARDELLDRLRLVTQGELEVVRQLGRGGMARVYLARQLRLQREIAVKVISPDLLSQPDMVQRFRREASTIASLRHPNIVAVYDAHEGQGLHWFTMELVRGRSLTELLEAASTTARVLPIALVRALLYQIASALAYAHRRGVIHRDVKPQNVLLDERGDCLVTDFGLAKIASAPSLTQPNMIMGTPHYMSPEQWCGLEVGAPTDQYALGVIAYEMLTGVRPFTGSTESIMLAHVTTPPAAIDTHRADIPGELRAGVMRMLAKRPEDRWPDLDAAIREMQLAPLAPGHELQSAVVAVIRDGRWPTGISNPAATSPAPIRRTSRSRFALLAAWRPVRIAAIPTLLVVVSGGTYLLTRGHRARSSDSATVAAPLITPARPVEATPARPNASALWLDLAAAEQLTDGAQYDSASAILRRMTVTLDSLQRAGTRDSAIDRLVDRLRSVSQRNHLACAAERAILARRSALAAPECQ